MGHSFIFLPFRMIRVLAFLCLIALALGEAVPDAKPDADPYYGYGLYGYGLGLGHLGYYVPGKRRSADADAVPDAEPTAEADPWLYYGHLGGYYGHGYYGGYYPYRYYYGR